MRRLVATLLIAAGLLTATVGVVLAVNPPTSEIIVTLTDSAPDSATAAAVPAERYGMTIGSVWTEAIHGFAGSIPTARLEELRADPYVALIEPNAPVFATATD